MKRLTALTLVVLLSGCASPGVGGYTVDELRANLKWQALMGRLMEYKRIVCVYCGPDVWKMGVMKTDIVNGFAMGGGTFYVTDGLLAQPFYIQDALLAHEVAHEIAGHVPVRKVISVATTGVFFVLGLLVPGAGLLNLAVNPVAANAYGRPAELEADNIAISLLRQLRKDDSSIDSSSIGSMIALIETSKSQGSTGGGPFATHPHPDDRIDQLLKIEAGTVPMKAIPSYSR